MTIYKLRLIFKPYSELLTSAPSLTPLSMCPIRPPIYLYIPTIREVAKPRFHKAHSSHPLAGSLSSTNHPVDPPRRQRPTQLCAKLIQGWKDPLLSDLTFTLRITQKRFKRSLKGREGYKTQVRGKRTALLLYKDPNQSLTLLTMTVIFSFLFNRIKTKRTYLECKEL